MDVMIAIVLLIFSSAMYHVIMTKVEDKRYQPPGKLLEIDDTDVT